MPRRPRVRAATASLPPKEYYMGHLAPLLAAQEQRVSPSAVHLWTVLRAHAWRDGCCDLSDRELAAWMGGLSLRQIYNLRTELAAAGLLAIARTEDGVRWLMPLPLDEREGRKSGNLFPEIDCRGNEALKEEVNINTIPPPPLTPPPPGEFTGSGEGDAAALARFLVEHGAFPEVAAALAEVLLGRMAREEAEIYSLALLTAAEGSEDARSGRIDGERVLGRWVARMRSGVRPPAWAVAEARAALAAGRDAQAGGGLAPAGDDEAGFSGGAGRDSGPGEPGEPEEEGDGWSGDSGEEANGVDEVGEAEERPWIVNGGRACSHRELWDLALDHLRLQLPASTFDTWLRGSACTGTDSSGRTLVVQVRDRYAVDWLTLRLRRLVLRTVEGITGLGDLEVRFEEG